MKNIISSVILSLSIVFLFTACSKDNDAPTPAPAGPDVDFFALTADNRILVLNGQSTTVAQATLNITGLQSGETILGIDFRPNTGQLFGIGSTSRLYVINVLTGAATALGTTPFTPAISGTTLGFDFNPTVDRIRLVTSTGQNLRLNPETGALAATDGAINGVTGAMISGAAYTQSRAGATSTILFDIDPATDKLYRQDPPNAGTLVAVGDLGIDVTAVGGFDISYDSSFALASLTVGTTSSLYTINLSTGAATKAGDFGTQITGLAIPTQPVAYAVSATNNLLILDPSSGAVSFTKTITGLQPSENILGIDMRPATGQIFALGSSSRLYTINVTSGAATMIGAGALTTTLNGTDFGFDFNPTVDRIRVVSNAGQNLRLNPLDGSVAAVDGNINPGASVISASAYTNNFAGATATVLFNLDATTDRLVRQDPPNSGTIVDIGALGINIESANGFDITGTSGVAYGIFTVGGSSKLYSVNLTTGMATAGPAFAEGVRGFTLGLGL